MNGNDKGSSTNGTSCNGATTKNEKQQIKNGDQQQIKNGDATQASNGHHQSEEATLNDKYTPIAIHLRLYPEPFEGIDTERIHEQIYWDVNINGFESQKVEDKLLLRL